MFKTKRVLLYALALSCVAISTEAVEEPMSKSEWVVYEIEGHRFDGVVSEPYFDMALNDLYLAVNIARWADPDWQTTDMAWAEACGPYVFGIAVNMQINYLCYVLSHDKNGSGYRINHDNQRVDLEEVREVVGQLYRTVDYIGPDRTPEFALRNERDR